MFPALVIMKWTTSYMVWYFCGIIYGKY